MELNTFFNFRKSIKISEFLILAAITFCGLFWATGFYYLGTVIGVFAILLIIAKVIYSKYVGTEDETMGKIPQLIAKWMHIIEYGMLIATAFCGIFWKKGFYYLGIVLGFFALVLIICKVYYMKPVSADAEKDESNAEKVKSSESKVEKDDSYTPIFKYNDAEDEEVVTSEKSKSEEEKIPNGLFFIEDFEEVNSEKNDDEELSESGKKLLAELKVKMVAYEKALSSNESAEKLDKFEEELDELEIKIEKDRQDTKKAKAEAEAKAKAEAEAKAKAEAEAKAKAEAEAKAKAEAEAKAKAEAEAKAKAEAEAKAREERLKRLNERKSKYL